MHATFAPTLVRRVGLPLLGFFLSLTCAVMVPALCLPMALVMPLIVCPGRLSVGLWFSMLMSLAPVTGLFLAGAPAPLCVLSFSFSFISLLISLLIQERGMDVITSALWHAAGMLLALALLCGQTAKMLGTGLFEGLADYAVSAVQRHPQGDEWLYSLLSMGVLRLPKNLESLAGALGGSILQLPAVRTELLRGLHFQVLALLRQSLPALLAQVSVVIGLFAALGTIRISLRQSAGPILALQGDGNASLLLPSFRSLYLPRPYRPWLLGTALLALILGSTPGSDAVGITGEMLFSAVFAVYCLLGAATWVFLLTHQRSGRTLYAGISAGILFLVFPTLLLILGVADQVMHIRAALLLPKEHEEE